MSLTYTIKYSKNDSDSKITVLENDNELTSFSEGDPNFEEILSSFPAFSKLEPGMEICVTGTIEDFNAKYGVDLDITDEPDNDSDDNKTEEEKENSDETEIDVEDNDDSNEESEEKEEVCDKCEKCPCVCENDEETAKHLDTDAGHLNEIESRVAEIESTLSNLSNAFGAVGEDAEAIEDTVDEMEAEDDEVEDKDNFTEPDEAADVKEKEPEDAFYSGSRVWSDPAEFTDSSFAVIETPSEEKEELKETSYYDMYEDEYEEWVEPKKKIGKFRL